MPANKTYPVVRTFGLNTPTGSFPQPQVEVNVEQQLSKVNRRLYRHGREYEVKLDLGDACISERLCSVAQGLFGRIDKRSKIEVAHGSAARTSNQLRLSGNRGC